MERCRCKERTGGAKSRKPSRRQRRRGVGERRTWPGWPGESQVVTRVRRVVMVGVGTGQAETGLRSSLESWVGWEGECEIV
jgi:hypothetical protein